MEEGNNLKPEAIRILESYIKSIFTLVQIQYAEQPEGRGFDSLSRYYDKNERKFIFIIWFVFNL